MSQNIVIGTIWSFIQRFGSLVISFVSNMVLARLLCPEDFGTMGMIMVFVSFADVLVDGGLGNALIQKETITQKDLSTVFTANLLFSVFLFISLFFFSPFIESYTKIDRLSLYLRLESVLILTRAFYTVPFSLLAKSLRFKLLAKINLLATGISVVVAIVLAYSGFGVWSLILRNIILDVILLFAYIIASRCHLIIGFNKDSFNQLFGFGFFVVASNLVENVYANITSFFVGKKYSVKDLGYYNQAYSLQQIPVYSMTSVLNQVLFPYFSRLQNNESVLKDRLKLSIQIITFFVFPILLFLIVYAEPVIIILYSEKWIPCVPFFQLFCIGGLFNALIHINRSLLKSLGYTKRIFLIQLVTSIFGLVLLMIGLRINLIATVVAHVFTTIIVFGTTVYVAGKTVRYSVFTQLYDVSVNILFSIIAVIFCYLLFRTTEWNLLLQLLLEATVYALIYVLLHYFFKTSIGSSLVSIYKSLHK